MAEFCLVASHGYPPGLVLYPDQSLRTPLKEYQPLLPSFGSRHDTAKCCSPCLESYQTEEAWKPIVGLSEGTQIIKMDQALRRHVINGTQAATNQNLILLSFGIARQIMRQEKILKFLSGSSVIESGEVDISALPDLTGFQELRIDMPQEPFVLERSWFPNEAEPRPLLFYPTSECYIPKPFLDLTKSVSHESEFVCEPHDQLAFTSSATRLEDILPIIAEFYSSKSSTKSERHSLLVPYFERRKKSTAKTSSHGSPIKLETMRVAQEKSPEKAKAKQSAKKRNSRKTDREKDMYSKNYVLACESLLSIMIDKKRHGKTAIQSLKKSGPELPQILTQFSASIAGTGIAVLFSIICKLVCSCTPICMSNVLSSGLGLGLVWFSWAINRLRDTVLYISKSPSKSDQGEEDMLKILDRSVNEIYFRAASLLAVLVLRLA